MNAAWLDEIKWTDDGLVPAIAQDAASGRVLMFAWMNRESLQKLWHKGEESGHIQKVKTMQLDCDGDVILLEIEQLGGIACHTGRQSCFYKEFKNGQWQAVDPVLKDPDAIYNRTDKNE
jgi:phosphoribosyl-AMP cyclohydrolase